MYLYFLWVHIEIHIDVAGYFLDECVVSCSLTDTSEIRVS